MARFRAENGQKDSGQIGGIIYFIKPITADASVF